MVLFRSKIRNNHLVFIYLAHKQTFLKKIFLNILAGLLVGSISFLFRVYTGTFLGLSVYYLLSLAALIACLILTFFYPETPAINAVQVWADVELAILLRAVFDLVFIDPASHSLLGLELIFTSAFVMPSSFVGAYLAKLLHRTKHAN